MWARIYFQHNKKDRMNGRNNNKNELSAFQTRNDTLLLVLLLLQQYLKIFTACTVYTVSNSLYIGRLELMKELDDVHSVRPTLSFVNYSMSHPQNTIVLVSLCNVEFNLTFCDAPKPFRASQQSLNTYWIELRKKWNYSSVAIALLLSLLIICFFPSFSFIQFSGLKAFASCGVCQSVSQQQYSSIFFFVLFSFAAVLHSLVGWFECVAVHVPRLVCAVCFVHCAWEDESQSKAIAIYVPNYVCHSDSEYPFIWKWLRDNGRLCNVLN